ncbi:uncharacterized protein TNCV_5141701 [Trichonephila clavipes]|nr:uncharacterized protein TNCV_5141701 [Trichonephila clavipes]
MLEKVIENWTSRLDYIRASHGSPMPEIIFKMHSSSQPSSPSEKGTEENESEGSNVELLSPVQDLIDQSKSESEAAAAETQMHLSRVRQRISELLDDAFALAGGRRLYGSLRSKKIEPATDIFPRYGSFRSHSATEGEFAFANASSSKVRKCVSDGNFPRLKQCLVSWMRQCRGQNIPMGGSLLKEKAKAFAKELGIEFSASEGWLTNFKKRNGIVFKKCGESLSVDINVCSKWQNSLSDCSNSNF